MHGQLWENIFISNSTKASIYDTFQGIPRPLIVMKKHAGILILPENTAICDRFKVHHVHHYI